jgi:hypothetical protein
MEMDAVTDTVKETGKRQSKKPLKAETSRDKFLRLGPNRMETALKKISLIGNLAGHGYEYETGEVKQMLAALKEAVEEVEAKFNNKKSGRRGGFSFKKGSGS